MKKLILLLLATTSLSAFAGNYSFMNQSPIGNFTTEDSRLFANASSYALNNTPDGDTVTWHNKNTRTNGSFTPLNSFIKNGNKCRTMKVFTDAQGMKNVSKFEFCKVNDRWAPAS